MRSPEVFMPIGVPCSPRAARRPAVRASGIWWLVMAGLGTATAAVTYVDFDLRYRLPLVVSVIPAAGCHRGAGWRALRPQGIGPGRLLTGRPPKRSEANVAGGGRRLAAGRALLEVIRFDRDRLDAAYRANTGDARESPALSSGRSAAALRCRGLGRRPPSGERAQPHRCATGEPRGDRAVGPSWQLS